MGFAGALPLSRQGVAQQKLHSHGLLESWWVAESVLFFLVSLVRGLSIFDIFKEAAFGFIDFLYFLFSISLISSLIIIFLLLVFLLF